MSLEDALLGTPYGRWTEEVARQASARGGQPDFVYKGVLVRRGAATREVGDHLLLLGHQLAIVSVKSRDITLKGKDDDSRARRWLDKNIATAARQIAGTRRTLWSQGGIQLVSDRGVAVPWEPDRVSEVYGLILINYSAPDNYVATPGGGNLALQMQTWLDVNQALSAGGIFNYLKWRADRSVPLSLELERDLLAEELIQDAKMGPASDPNVTPRTGAWEDLVASHPTYLRGQNPDYRWANVIDAIIGAAHEQDPQFGILRSPHDYLDMIEILERLHPDTKIEMGKRILEKCRLASEQKRRRYFASQDGDGGLIVFLSDPTPRDERREFLQMLVFALHTSTSEQGPNLAKRTLGIATEPYPGAGRSHDFVLLRGEIAVEDETADVRDAWLAGVVGPPRPVDEEVLLRLHDPIAEDPSVTDR